MAEARPFLDELQHQAYSNPLYNNEILHGLYTGKYYEECLQFFKGLRALDPSGQNLGDATSYHCAMKAAYQLHDYRYVMEVYNLAKKQGVRMTRSIVYIIAEVSLKERVDYRFMSGVISGELSMSRISVFCGRTVLFQRSNSMTGS